MSHVIVWYQEEDYEGNCIDNLFIEGDYNQVLWDGYLLKLGNKEIKSHEWFELQLKLNDGCGYAGGFYEIDYLQIDDVVIIDRKEAAGGKN